MIERRAVTVAVEGISTLVNGWQCVCDACGETAPGRRDAGDASDAARSAGFCIVRGEWASQPSRWLCAPCVERMTAPRKKGALPLLWSGQLGAVAVEVRQGPA